MIGLGACRYDDVRGGVANAVDFDRAGAGELDRDRAAT